jgi:antitoxin component YwqK of YwqJK toxin-antitoxin module
MPLLSQAQITKKKSNPSSEAVLTTQKESFGGPEYYGKRIADTIFYPNRIIKAIGFYAVDSKGKKLYYRTGLWAEYYSNGKLKSIGNFDFRTVYSCCGGTLCQQVCLYKIGEWTYYYDNGFVKAKGSYMVEKTEANTNIENQFIYRSLITDDWLFYDKDGQTAKDKARIILDLERPEL